MRLSYLSLTAFVSLFTLSASAQERGFARYEECIKRIAFIHHGMAWAALGQTNDPRAVEIFIDDYKKHPVSTEFARYLMAAHGTRHLKALEVMDGLNEWRMTYDDPEDAWLWMRTLRNCAQRGKGEWAEEVVRDKKEEFFLRAAALDGLAQAGDTRLFTLASEIALDMPKKPEERSVFVGALADALVSLKGKRSTKEYRSMAVPIIRLLDDEDLPYSAKLVIARHLMVALDQKTLVMDSQPWVNILANLAKKQTTQPTAKSDLEYVKPTFFGVEGTGKRIVYVIDASDSMCKKITGKPKGPVTGGKREKSDLPTEADIPWAIVHTRFDLAREHLKISLKRLSEDQSFCVVLFGDGARTLDATKGLVQAKKNAVKKAIKELDKIQEGPPAGTRVDGTLEGDTNMHAGLRLAFSVIDKKPLDETPYVDLEAHLEGADTIFLLSDGDPTCDDWPMQDAPYPEFNVVTDFETKNPAAPTGNRMNYFGPFQNWHNLLEEVRRMNMFREVELHAIAIGEVQMPFLEMLAKIGLGKAVKVGNN